MKSLNKNPIEENKPEIFTPEISKYINEEGFEYKSNDSYCYSALMEYNKEVEYLENCYYKYIPDANDFTVNVYIFENGIGVDVDYDCGGNLHTIFFEFSDYSFEEAYDKMVDYVNEYRS